VGEEVCNGSIAPVLQMTNHENRLLMTDGTFKVGQISDQRRDPVHSRILYAMENIFPGPRTREAVPDIRWPVCLIS
jgi:hypothetical protein